MLIIRVHTILICLCLISSINISYALSPAEEFQYYKSCQCNPQPVLKHSQYAAPLELFTFDLKQYQIKDNWVLLEQHLEPQPLSFLFDHTFLSQLYLNLMQKDKHSKDNQLSATADKILLDRKNSNILQGNVAITANNIVVTSDHALLNTTEKKIHLSDNIHLNIPGSGFKASSIKFDKTNNHAVINNLETFISDEQVNIAAKSITVDKQIYTLEQVILNLCNPDNKAWHIQADKIILNKQENLGEMFYGWLAFYEQPIIPLPYLQFPLQDRKTGLLNFDVRINSDANVKSFNIPYYFNLATNYDATITAQYERLYGLSLDTEFRYLNQYSQTDIQFSNLLPFFS